MPVVTDNELSPFREDEAKKIQAESGFTDTMKALGSVGNGLVADASAPAPAPTAAGGLDTSPLVSGAESGPSSTPVPPPVASPQPQQPQWTPQLPNETPPPNQGQFSPYDDIFKRHAGDLANNPEFISIVAAGTKAESQWDASNRTGDGGHSWGLFQMHDGGAGAGMGESRLDPNAASAVMVPRYAAAFMRFKQQGLSGPALAAAVAQDAERSADPTGAAYAKAYQQIMGGSGYVGPATQYPTAKTDATQTPQSPTPPDHSRELTDTLNALAQFKEQASSSVAQAGSSAVGGLQATLDKIKQMGQQGAEWLGTGLQEQAQGRQQIGDAIAGAQLPVNQNLVGAATKQMQADTGISPYERGQEQLSPEEQYVQGRSMATGLASTLNPEVQAFGGLAPNIGRIARGVASFLHPNVESAAADVASEAPSALQQITKSATDRIRQDDLLRSVDQSAQARIAADDASRVTSAPQGPTDLYNTGGTSPPRGGVVDEAGKPLPNHNPEALTLAQDYAHEQGLDDLPTTRYVKPDEETQRRIADFYDKAQSNPDDPAVQSSYNAFKQEVAQQYQFLEENGVKFEPYHDPEVPYKSSTEMMADVRDNRHMFVYADSLDSPVLSPEENWMFRAVHDYFGHAANGLSFGPRGEENAWISHSKMFSPEAVPAMTTETRGQNSWVNFGPVGEQNRANPAATTFAEQKAILLPEEFHQRPDAYLADSTEAVTPHPATEPQPNLAFEQPSPSAQRPPLPNGDAVNAALQQRLGLEPGAGGGGRPGTSPFEPEVAATLPSRPAPGGGDLSDQLAQSLIKVMKDHGYSEDAINERLAQGGFATAKDEGGQLQPVRQVAGGAIEAPANPEAGVKYTLDNGGGTLDPQTLQPVSIAEGFAVSRPGGVVLDQADFTPEALQDFAKDVGKGSYVGTWVDNGKVYLDATDVVPDREQALALGAKNQQQAIYDFGKGEAVDVPKTAEAAAPAQPGILDRVKDMLGGKQEGQVRLNSTTNADDIQRLVDQHGPDVPASELAKLPGMKDTRSSLGDIHTAVQVGKRFSGWYKEVANWFLKEVGPDNLHEALSIFAHTSPGASVADNASAVTSLMRAVRQVKQEGLWDLARTRKLFESAKNITEFAKNAIGTAEEAGLDPAMSRIWEIVNGEDHSRNVMRINLGKMMQGYLTGKVIQTANAKTYSYFENLLNSVADMMHFTKGGPDMRATIDQFMGKLFNPLETGAGMKAQEDPNWYRSAEAIIQHVAGAAKMTPNEAQAAAWFALRSIVGKAVPRPPEILAIARKLQSGEMGTSEAILAADKTGFFDDMFKAGQTFSEETGQPASLREVYKNPQYQLATRNAKAAGIDLKSPPPDDVQRNIRVVYPDTWHKQVAGVGVPGREADDVFPNLLTGPTGGAEPAQAGFRFATTVGGAGAGGLHALTTTDPNDPDRWKKVAGEASVGALAGYTGGKAIEGLAKRGSTAALPHWVNSLTNPAGNVPDNVRAALNNYDGLIASTTTKADRDLANGAITQLQHDDTIDNIKTQARQFFLDDLTGSDGVMPRIQQTASGSHVSVSPPDGWVGGDKLGGGAAGSLGSYWVSPETAQVIKNTLTHEPTPILSGLATIQGRAKQIILNTPFHGLQEELQAIRLGVGTGNPGAGMGGGQAIWHSVNPQAFAKWFNDPQTGKWVDRMVNAGGTLRVGEAVDMTRGLRQAAINGAVGGGLSGITTYGTEKSQGVPEDQARVDAARNAILGFVLTGPMGTAVGNGIFDRQIPTLKVNSFRTLVQGGMADEAAAQLVNSTYGGQNLVRMARSRGVQDALRVATFAPDWWEGIIKTFGNAIPGMSGSGEVGATSRRQVAVGLAGAAVTLEGLQLLLTGHTADKNQDGYQLQLEVPHSMVAGRVPGAPPGVQGQMDHIDILGWYRPLMELAGTAAAGDPLGGAKKFVTGRAGTLMGVGSAVATNKDWRGQDIVPPGATPMEQVGDIADYAVNQVQPGGAQSVGKAAQIAGPAGAAASYGTGFRVTAQTPLGDQLRSYSEQKPQIEAQITEWLKQQPEYKSATPAERSVMVHQATTQADQQVRSGIGMEPADFGMPPRYVGVTDRKQELAITDAHAKVTAYDNDPRHAARPSTKERLLAEKANETPQYKAAVAKRTQSNHGLDVRLQDQLGQFKSH